MMVHLVLNSTLAYVEVPTLSPPTMRALVAKGNPFTSNCNQKALQPTSDNTEVPVGLIQFTHITLVLTTAVCGTDPHIAACIKTQCPTMLLPAITMISNLLILPHFVTRSNVSLLKWMPSSLP